jgi:predicted alpha/beta-hydrolase family hydrolase
MSSTAASDGLIPGVRGLVFFGFPLHPPGRPSIDRAEHLGGVAVPMLFLQGTRDTLADLDLLEPFVADLDQATLHVVEGADHSFHVLKRSGRTDEEVLDEITDRAAGWIDSVLDGNPP